MTAVRSNLYWWRSRAVLLLATVVAVHVLTIWAAPRVIMQIVMNGPSAKKLDMQNHAVFSPAIDAASRTVVMPSPDMLYSLCVFDVAAGAVRVTANPALKSYWSIALYAANSDNFFVVNDRQAGDGPVDLWLVAENSKSSAQAVPPGAKVVVVPSTQGLLLMRVLTGNYEAEKAVVEPARRTLQCAQVVA